MSAESLVELVYGSGPSLEQLTVPSSLILPSTVASLFSLIPSPLLIDSQSRVLRPSDDGSLYTNIEGAQPPYRVIGTKLPTAVVAQPAFSTPNASGVFRPPAPPAFGSVASRSPFGGRSHRPTAPPPPATPTTPSFKVIKVTKAEWGTVNGRQKVKSLFQIVHLRLAEGDCNVASVNALLQSKEGFQERVICDASGSPIEDDDFTSTPAYWGFGRGSACNATKYYALPPRPAEEAESDSSDDDRPGPMRRRRRNGNRAELKHLVSQMLEKVLERRNVGASASSDSPSTSAENQSAMRASLKCTICLNISADPTICKECGALLGCFACVEQWATDHDTCPLARCDWPPSGSGTVGYTKMRFPFDNVPGLY